jgi:hypothetical protein
VGSGIGKLRASADSNQPAIASRSMSSASTSVSPVVKQPGSYGTSARNPSAGLPLSTLR